MARLDAAQALQRLGTSNNGLTAAEAAERLRAFGANAVRSHGARPLRVLGRQLDNPLLILLAVAAVISFATGQEVDALIILAIVALSVGLGFVNEYRSERAVEELHGRIRHEAVALRDGEPRKVDVTELVPGDVVILGVGDVIPADLRLLEADRLECDEAVLTGESAPAAKDAGRCDGASLLDLRCCAFMGTVVKAGRGRGLVVRTGTGTKFGTIAEGLGRRPAETAFQQGLRDFAKLLVRVTVVLAATIFVINLAVHRPLLESMLFVLAIAVGLTPELLPAIVTVSLAMGARRLAARSVIVKRLVTIEDLGNIEVLFTDKTGTLTEGQLEFRAAIDSRGGASAEVLKLGLLCHDEIFDPARLADGNPLDRALWQAPHDSQADHTRTRRRPVVQRARPPRHRLSHRSSGGRAVLRSTPRFASAMATRSATGSWRASSAECGPSSASPQSPTIASRIETAAGAQVSRPWESRAIDRLRDWFAARLPDARDVTVEGIDRITFGHSAETVLLTLVWRASDGEERRDVVLRLRPPPPGLLEPYDLHRQFTILRALERTAVPAPRALWYEGSGDVLGREFLSNGRTWTRTRDLLHVSQQGPWRPHRWLTSWTFVSLTS